ncbi:hypothetical protein NM688_g5163 [Phlebia brevispora]|uniref:Uncharacterized protein n=1 Tax=Phlebia brevispora TaxID=194682 RepID=A0ACC1SZJ7_9APHY|nr:hypothetical protein NM688_g5163 [Phlebia brevispora]
MTARDEQDCAFHTEDDTFELSGGGRKALITVNKLTQYPVHYGSLHRLNLADRLPLVNVQCVCDSRNAASPYELSSLLPYALLISIASKPQLRYVAKLHNINLVRLHCPIAEIREEMACHQCNEDCDVTVAVFARPSFQANSPFMVTWKADTQIKSGVDMGSQTRPEKSETSSVNEHGHHFPPKPHSVRALSEIVGAWVDAIAAENVVDIPCGVCARGIPVAETEQVNLDDPMLTLLYEHSERATAGRITQKDGPKILYEPSIKQTPNGKEATVCKTCYNSLSKHKEIPRMAQVNGLWLGEVPDELRNLNFVEKLVIARYRHNVCTAEIRKGPTRKKMKANAVVFAQPIAKLTTKLPRPREELDECLVILFTGSTDPTKEDFRRTPFLIRRDAVWNALIWLTRNHKDYKDVELSYKNLMTYPEDEPPVAVFYSPGSGEEPVQARSVFDHEVEKGVSESPCPFAVHGMTVDEYVSMEIDRLRAIATQHLRLGKGVLAYGSAGTPESIYENPQLYPGLFPWLFPYGLGGFENELQMRSIPKKTHIKCLLARFDRRFQCDEYFPYLIFNQQQIADLSWGGYALIYKSNFRNVTEKILEILIDALTSLLERAKLTSILRPENEAEKCCMEVVHLLDFVAGKVPVSNTQKKYQRNEIRGLMYEKGLPLWFFTFAPAEHMNSIALVMNGLMNEDEYQKMIIPMESDRLRSIADNPVACAKFFHFLVKTFLCVVLRVSEERTGLFGKTSAYYGTVESQGRLTLHLHLLIWIENALTLQQIHDKLLANETEFREQLTAWLESCHQGEFSTGSMKDIYARRVARSECPPVDPIEDIENLEEDEQDEQNPVLRKPRHPGYSKDQEELTEWFNSVRAETDDIALRCNRHIHHKDPRQDSCRKGPLKRCRARFPQPICPQTVVEEGTQAKAVIAYITDYVTKSPLKTYSIFETVKNVLESRSTVLAEAPSRSAAAKKLICKIVNGLTARMEIGGPMLCTHLLGYPDHYTGHRFKVCSWVSYVGRVRRAWHTDDEMSDDEPSDATEHEEHVVLQRSKDGNLVGVSKLNDYVYRPVDMENMSLHEFLCCTNVEKMTPETRKQIESARTVHFSGVPIIREYLDGDHIEGEEDPENEDDHSDYRRPYPFTSDHHNHETHAVFFVKGGKRYVLNFIGGTLPRPDKGDREEYCMTMLTLFCPSGWRSGLELKQQDESWEDAFTKTDFSVDSRRLMRNMHLLYECQDARDDYASLRKAEERAELFGQYFSLDIVQTAYLQPDGTSYESTRIEQELLQLVEQSSEIIGRETASVHNKMREMQEFMGRIEVLTLKESTPPEDTQRTDIFSSTLTATEWKHILQTTKEDELASRAPCDFDTANRLNNRYRDVVRYQDNEVRVTTAEELFREYTDMVRPIAPHTMNFDLRDQISRIIDEFSLNAEQTRAFTIIDLQLSGDHLTPLKMYLGGMEGTGKSQVIKAVTAFLKHRNEQHRMELCTPTGAAASIIGGSTYHSVLGFSRDDGGASVTKLSKVRGRLARVDIVFIDEVSMLSCLALYKISEQMSNAFDNPTEAFGRKSVVLCGDFGQLPPPGIGQSPLYSNTVGNSSSALTLQGQRKALDKAVWHMFDTHVLLRDNMRQKGISPADQRYRRLLAHVRLKSCDDEDMDLLDAITLRNDEQRLNGLDSKFKYVSIITAWNAHRDAINAYSIPRFATEHQMQIQPFYSLDKLCLPKESVGLREALGQQINSSLVAAIDGRMLERLRDLLWRLPPCLTEHLPGVLNLCVGMPVMLKSNEATELGATNGAKGRVYGWDCETLPDGKKTLQTLFMQLTNPPRTIRIGSLPENVIPISTTSTKIRCTLPDDSATWITRRQVPILPNFAMTDFAAQGRTRPINPVDIRKCKSHQAIYTCLSRSASISATTIMAPFDKRRLVGGPSTDLKRELRELEIMDDITTRRIAGTLPASICSPTRAEYIQSYQKTFGIFHIPARVEPALRWDQEDEHTLRCHRTADRWENLSARRKRTGQLKRKSGDSNAEHSKKRFPLVSLKNMSSECPTGTRRPIGLPWDETNWSCAYDAVLTILYNGQRDYGMLDQVRLSGESVDDILMFNLQKLREKQIMLNTIRDAIRT